MCISTVPTVSSGLPPTPQFSDVIAGAGTSGLPAAFRTPYDIRPVAKNETNRRPLNCRVKNRLNRVFLRNNLIKQYFLVAWTPLPIKPENRISRLAIGARNELQIDHISLEAGISLFSLDPWEIVVLKTGVFSSSLDFILSGMRKGLHYR